MKPKITAELCDATSTPKTKYLSATNAMNSAEARGFRRPRYYRCPSCDWWHLSHSELDPSTERLLGRAQDRANRLSAKERQEEEWYREQDERSARLRSKGFYRG